MAQLPVTRERRRFIRMAPSSIGVAYQVVGQEAKGTLQGAKDVSQSGIRFPVSERLPRGTRLDLRISLLGDSPPIQAQGEVVWSAGFRRDGAQEVGCRFLHIDPLDRGRVIRHIHEVLKQRKPFIS